MPLYDSMVSTNVMPEKRERFCTVVNNLFFSLKLSTDIQPIFTASYRRKVGQSSALVNEVFAIAESAMKNITVSKTFSAEFFNNLSIDQNGNVQVVLTNDFPKPYTSTLNRYHKYPRSKHRMIC